ncbi:MAG: DNA polymerase I [Pseudomonadota bacterium]
MDDKNESHNNDTIIKQDDSISGNASQKEDLDSESKEDLYIFDGYSIFFRAYYANAKLVYKDQPVGMLYGAINSILKLFKMFRPTNVIFALDGPGKNFRHDMFSEYKANRTKIDNDLIVQLQQIPMILDALQVPYIQKNNYEADDIIASIAAQCSKKNLFKKIIIVGVDKDLLQLVDDKINVYHTMLNTILDNKFIKKKYGIDAVQVIDYLALVGDSSDNIPGVKSVGPKTAALLLQEYKTLDNILDSVSQITKPSLQKNLITYKEDALLSRKLVILERDIDLKIDFIQYFQYKPVKNIDTLVDTFGFKVLSSKVISLFNLYSKEKSASHAKSIIELDNRDELLSILDQVREDGIFCFIVIGSNFHFGLMNSSCEYSVNKIELLQEVLNFILSGDVINITFDLKSVLYYLNYSVDMVYTGSIRNKILNIDDIVKHAIMDQTQQYHNYIIHDLEILYYLYAKGKRVDSFESLMSSFDANSIASMYDVFCILSQRLVENKQYYLYQDVELYMPYIIYQMEKNGIMLDVQALDKINFIIDRQLSDITQKIYQICGGSFQISSNKVLGEILFEKLKLPYAKKLRKSNTYATDSDVLYNISYDGFEIGDLILQWRKLIKLQNTYVEKLPNHVINGRVHANFNTLGTVSGRLSSNNPNLQNIPVTKEYNIRAAFRASDNAQLISFDYSQIELVILAYLIDEPNMKQAFEKGIDIHTMTAASIFDVYELDLVSDRQRKRAKSINFGIIYGMSAFGLSKALKISVYEARGYIDAYFKKYPKIQKFIAQQLLSGEEKGYVANVFNRQCILEDRNLRAAINLPIQSAAADILKFAMIKIYQILPFFKAKMVLQVHDELVFEVNDKCRNDFILKVRQIMEDAHYPLKVNVKNDINWS